MEIQSFILCAGITPTAGGRIKMFDGQVMGIRSFFPNPGINYPLRHPMPFFILLRREHKDYDEQCSLRFDLVDQDGKHIVPPLSGVVTIAMPDGQATETMNFVVNMQGLKIEKPGTLSIDLAVDGRHEMSLPIYIIEKKFT